MLDMCNCHETMALSKYCATARGGGVKIMFDIVIYILRGMWFIKQLRNGRYEI